MNDYLLALANAIRDFRVTNGWTQEKMAEILDITVSQVQNIEQMRRRPSLRVLRELVARGFTVDAALRGAPDVLREKTAALAANLSDDEVRILNRMLTVYLEEKDIH